MAPTKNRLCRTLPVLALLLGAAIVPPPSWAGESLPIIVSKRQMRALDTLSEDLMFFTDRRKPLKSITRLGSGALAAWGAGPEAIEEFIGIFGIDESASKVPYRATSGFRFEENHGVRLFITHAPYAEDITGSGGGVQLEFMTKSMLALRERGETGPGQESFGKPPFKVSPKAKYLKKESARHLKWDATNAWVYAVSMGMEKVVGFYKPQMDGMEIYKDSPSLFLAVSPSVELRIQPKGDGRVLVSMIERPSNAVTFSPGTGGSRRRSGTITNRRRRRKNTAPARILDIENRCKTIECVQQRGSLF